VSELQIKMLVNHALPRDVTAGYIMASVESLREPAEKVADRIARQCSRELKNNALYNCYRGPVIFLQSSCPGKARRPRAVWRQTAWRDALVLHRPVSIRPTV
jgi:hypothetical protein